jgi:hypothetical protein
MCDAISIPHARPPQPFVRTSIDVTQIPDREEREGAGLRTQKSGDGSWGGDHSVQVWRDQPINGPETE